MFDATPSRGAPSQPLEPLAFIMASALEHSRPANASYGPPAHSSPESPHGIRVRVSLLDRAGGLPTPRAPVIALTARSPAYNPSPTGAGETLPNPSV